jgi:hypothetical protein
MKQCCKDCLFCIPLNPYFCSCYEKSLSELDVVSKNNCEEFVYESEGLDDVY